MQNVIRFDWYGVTDIKYIFKIMKLVSNKLHLTLKNQTFSMQKVNLCCLPINQIFNYENDWKTVYSFRCDLQKQCHENKPGWLCRYHNHENC